MNLTTEDLIDSIVRVGLENKRTINPDGTVWMSDGPLASLLGSAFGDLYRNPVFVEALRVAFLKHVDEIASQIAARFPERIIRTETGYGRGTTYVDPPFLQAIQQTLSDALTRNSKSVLAELDLESLRKAGVTVNVQIVPNPR